MGLSERLQMAFGQLTGSMKTGAGGEEAAVRTADGNPLSKNHEFYVETLEELNSKLRALDSKFGLIQVALAGRGVSEDEIDRERLAELIVRSKESAEDSPTRNLEEKNAVELLRMLEESVNDKQKTFRLKRQFMENIRKMKEAQQTELSKLFDKLNQVEDEYLVSERVLSNLQAAIRQNNEEIAQVQNRMQSADDERHTLEVEVHRLEEELQAVKNRQGQQGSEQSALAKKIGEYKAQLSVKLREAEEAQARLVGEQMSAFENKQKLEFVENYAVEIAKEMQTLQKDKTKREAELSTKIQALRDAVRQKGRAEDEVERIRGLLATIDGTDFSKGCFCELREDAKNGYYEVVYKADQLMHQKQPYAFYEQLVTDFLAEKDVS